MPFPLFLSAAIYVILAASGLLLGAIVGLVVHPPRRVVAAVMAFGGGTLLAAVAISLSKEAYDHGGPVILVAGFFVGGFVFVLADTIISSKGGFLRREGTRHVFLKRKRRERAEDILAKLAEVDIFRSLPPEEVHAVVPYVKASVFKDGEVVFKKGETGDALYLVTSGKVLVTDEETTLATLEAGAAFGEMALLTGEPRNATIAASGAVRAYRIARHDFDHLIKQSPALAHAVTQLLEAHADERRRRAGATSAEAWLKAGEIKLDVAPTASEDKEIIEAHGGSQAGVAIFLGALVDAIPESLVIGATVVATQSPSVAFMLAVFLSNFPEAMSSASGLTKAGFSRQRILGMWIGLIVASGVFAVLGNVLLSGAPPQVNAVAESFAGGAILALLANTMMPEAFELGGRAAAFSTIAGFLVAFLAAAVSVA